MRLTLTVTLDLTDEQADRFAYVYGHRPNEIVDAVAEHATTTLQGDTLGQYATITVKHQAPRPATDELPDGDQALSLAEAAGFEVVQRVLVEDLDRWLLKHSDGRELRVVIEPNASRFYLAQGTRGRWPASARQITSVAALKRELGRR